MQEVPHNHEDFDRFFCTYSPLVFSIALRILHKSHDAEDIVQGVFLNLWSRPETFRGGNIESWLTTVTKNASLDRLRRSKRERIFTCLQTDFRVAADNPEELAVRRVICDAICDAVNRMEDARRDIVRAVIIEEQSHFIVAENRDVPLGTVKTRVRAGLAELRRQFSQARDIA